MVRQVFALSEVPVLTTTDCGHSVCHITTVVQPALRLSCAELDFSRLPVITSVPEYEFYVFFQLSTVVTIYVF